ncbi:acyl-CoA/acyl-ACP dehydrogenase [Streptomyces fulvoviolaceus]|uniref:acyl-CoA/acyl-ACP dehydrogenase n=1 Tax=Streptomyces fulvoviolaceus TaxID=285535 RepID=UPI0004C703B4|nr:acyl-CoA/acyl-ACP dehydrogenase [Streptomyces fulvoviolaceus]MCT9077903.1 acyl-CoA/acyl-ACP dehydrogenase [Streptomyces fulvoviolaceus]
MTLSTNGVLENVETLAHRLASERRFGARELSADHFAAVAATGFHQLLVPESMGGLWASTARSTRAVAHAISLIAAGASSLALILSMEPVAMFVTGWLADFHADEADPTCLCQRQEFVGLLASGAGAWGVLLSERTVRFATALSRARTATGRSRGRSPREAVGTMSPSC